MVDRKEMAAEIGGVAVGVLQTPVLRVYADPKYGVIVPQLGKFGTPSALGGIAAGVIALGIAYYGNEKRKLTDIQVSALETYGAAALVGGIASGVWPVPGVPGLTLSMDSPQIQTAARPYVPPLSPSYNRMDLEAVQKMSMEIQRLGGMVNTLANENAQLRTMTVASKQKAYSFMDPSTQAMVAPGHQMPGAKQVGFMDGIPPLAKIQQMKGSYGFLG